VEYYSSRNHSVRVSLRQAVLGSLPPDGGLYMPERIEQLPRGFFTSAHTRSFHEIALTMANSLLGRDPGEEILQRIIMEAFDFKVPLVKLTEGLYTLELFHGPTLAFKDIAARFMARLMACMAAGGERELHILVATSGDTGSAVAHGFHRVEGIRVHILFPSERVSPIQRAQLTTMGGNISALEVAGTFDDCQSMVKKAFLDSTIGARLMMSSANSINIARLIPQSFYYGWAWAQLEDHARPVVISVPSGNLGNLTAGLIAKRMGLPVRCFVAATNVNDALPRYLKTGRYLTRPTVTTISNAMDVGNPSNFMRILDLYDGDLLGLCDDMKGFSFGDDQTLAAMSELFSRYHYVADPHGAVGYLGMKSYLEGIDNSVSGIFLETAHPAKFPEILRQAAGISIQAPPQVRELQDKDSRAIRINNDFDELKEYLLSC
jgi:threonine synthase